MDEVDRRLRAELANKTILRPLDRPVKVDLRKTNCAAVEVYWQKIAVFGYGFVPLKDGTFLVIDLPRTAKSGDGDAIALRLDSELRSRSPLVGKRIFIVDTEHVHTLIRDANSSQAMQDRVAKYLVSIR